jgi:hypothetical protein
MGRYVHGRWIRRWLGLDFQSTRTQYHPTISFSLTFSLPVATAPCSPQPDLIGLHLQVGQKHHDETFAGQKRFFVRSSNFMIHFRLFVSALLPSLLLAIQIVTQVGSSRSPEPSSLCYKSHSFRRNYFERSRCFTSTHSRSRSIDWLCSIVPASSFTSSFDRFNRLQTTGFESS